MNDLYQVAINPETPLEIRYDAARMMQQNKLKLPKWKVRVLRYFATKTV